MYAATFILLGVVPACFVHLIIANYNRLDEERTKNMIGSLYLGIRTSSRLSAFAFVAFLVARLGFAIICFRLRRWPGVLVESYMILNLATIMYTGLVFPYESKS